MRLLVLTTKSFHSLDDNPGGLRTARLAGSPTGTELHPSELHPSDGADEAGKESAGVDDKLYTDEYGSVISLRKKDNPELKLRGKVNFRAKG